ncbi:unnamed protein product [Cylicocyclus nassatus]|uniref:Uncharacterized protein n=1 Tax=Cylicocyclus nassatus TaxID=53992 RepID=A0AA36GJB9_CYLNA|nr:unnamed protein product [Cylicocyclus nassatus]
MWFALLAMAVFIHLTFEEILHLKRRSVFERNEMRPMGMPGGRSVLQGNEMRPMGMSGGRSVFQGNEMRPMGMSGRGSVFQGNGMRPMGMPGGRPLGQNELRNTKFGEQKYYKMRPMRGYW